VFVIAAQNGYGAEGFRNLSRAFRYDEQLWDAIKDRRGRNGVTPLMFAAYKGDIERVRWLLARSSSLDLESMCSTEVWMNEQLNYAPEELKDVLKKHFGRMTALSFACAQGHLDVVRLLLKKNARDIKDKSLIIACELGNIDMARLILEERVLTEDDIYWWDDEEKTPLLVSIDYDHYDISLLLIDKGYDDGGGKVFDEGSNALIRTAAKKNCLPLLLRLLEVGADVNNNLDGYGFTALMAASENGNLETAKILLEKGANLNATFDGERGQTALILASEQGHLDLVKLLLSKGADKEIRDADGKNAFDVAKTKKIRKALK
jgi:ankyrin repeat protein